MIERIRYAEFPKEYYEDKSNGRLPADGDYVILHPNGTTHFKCNRTAGEFDGLCQWWFSSGKRMKQYMYVKGKIEGLFETWFENGKREFCHPYVNGMKNG
jgi:hypothetical protein